MSSVRFGAQSALKTDRLNHAFYSVLLQNVIGV
jgi:hypothetical protein